MSPLKIKVVINDCVNTLSITVGKPSLGPSRKLNVYLEGEVPEVKVMVGQYIAIGLVDSYGLIRCFDDEGEILVGQCLTLAGCQALALSDYLHYAELDIVSSEEDL